MSGHDELDGDSGTPIWAAFGDLMSVLLGAFVLILVGVVAMQLELSPFGDGNAARHIADRLCAAD